MRDYATFWVQVDRTCMLVGGAEVVLVCLRGAALVVGGVKVDGPKREASAVYFLIRQTPCGCLLGVLKWCWFA